MTKVAIHIAQAARGRADLFRYCGCSRGLGFMSQTPRRTLRINLRLCRVVIIPDFTRESIWHALVMRSKSACGEHRSDPMLRTGRGVALFLRPFRQQ